MERRRSIRAPCPVGRSVQGSAKILTPFARNLSKRYWLSPIMALTDIKPKDGPDTCRPRFFGTLLGFNAVDGKFEKPIAESPKLGRNHPR